MKLLITNYISQLEEIHYGAPWVGNSYKRILNNIDENRAFIQPFKGMHSIAEILSHCTMWRNEAVLKITRGMGTKTDDSEENWLSNSVLREIGWESIYNNHQSSVQELMIVLSDKEDNFLKQTYYDIDFKKKCTYKFLIDGMLHHDVYHLGQLGIIRKFLG